MRNSAYYYVFINVNLTLRSGKRDGERVPRMRAESGREDEGRSRAIARGSRVCLPG